MLPFVSMTATILFWLFGGITILHLIAMALVWIAVFVPCKVGFKNDPILRSCIGVYLTCEALVTLLAISGSIGTLLTAIGGLALFVGIGRLIRWLVMRRKKS